MELELDLLKNSKGKDGCDARTDNECNIFVQRETEKTRMFKQNKSWFWSR